MLSNHSQTLLRAASYFPLCTFPFKEVLKFLCSLWWLKSQPMMWATGYLHEKRSEPPSGKKEVNYSFFSSAFCFADILEYFCCVSSCTSARPPTHHWLCLVQVVIVRESSKRRQGLTKTLQRQRGREQRPEINIWLLTAGVKEGGGARTGGVQNIWPISMNVLILPGSLLKQPLIDTD